MEGPSISRRLEASLPHQVVRIVAEFQTARQANDSMRRKALRFSDVPGYNEREAACIAFADAPYVSRRPNHHRRKAPNPP